MTGGHGRIQRGLFGHGRRRWWKLTLQAVRLVARWPSCRLPARPRAPCGPTGLTGVNGLAAGGGGPVYWAQSHSLSKEKQKPELKLGAILNTIQSPLFPPPSSLPTHHAYIQTYLPLLPQGRAMGPSMWPWRCGLMARPVSGVEWSGGLMCVFVHNRGSNCRGIIAGNTALSNATNIR